jgi:hypothetical protein
MSLLFVVPMDSKPIPGDAVSLKLNEYSMIVADCIRSKLARLTRLFSTKETLPGLMMFNDCIAIIIWIALTMSHIIDIAYDKTICMITFTITVV